MGDTEPAGSTTVNGVTVHRFPDGRPPVLEYFADGKLRVTGHGHARTSAGGWR